MNGAPPIFQSAKVSGEIQLVGLPEDGEEDAVRQALGIRVNVFQHTGHAQFIEQLADVGRNRLQIHRFRMRCHNFVQRSKASAVHVLTVSEIQGEFCALFQHGIRAVEQ